MEYDRAFDVEMPIKGNTGMLLSEQPFEGQLAILDRLPTQVSAVDLDQVERAERSGMAIPVIAEQLENRKAIVILNAETIWNRPGKRSSGNHFVVVTGIDSRSGVVHLNDSGVETGGDEQVPLATFERAWAPNRNSAIVTRTAAR